MKLDISLYNIWKFQDLDIISFALIGIGVVFSGLLLISLYITVLPKLLMFLGLEKKKVAKKAPPPPKPANVEDKTNEEIMIAIATAIHLHQNYSDSSQKITGDLATWTESPWAQQGKAHNLAN